MGKGGGKAPAAPDPAKTAEAQTATNKETAYWNAVLNNVNQITPYGTLTYKQTGGGPQYNTQAYSDALAAWNANANKSPAVVTRQKVAPNGVGLGRITQYSNDGGKTWSNTPLSGGAGAMPKMEDFLISKDAPPQFTSTIELSPEQKAILDKQTANQTALLGLGSDQISRIRDSVSSPFSFSSLPSYGEQDQTAAAQRAEEALMARLNPQFQRDEEALRTRLINQGITQGSQAYNTEMERFNQAKNDARMQSILSGQQYGNAELEAALRRRNQGIQEYTTTRNAPLNEYIAMTSGTQVQNPTFQSQGYQGSQPVDYANLINNQYQSQLGQYNAQTASRNNTANSILGLGGSLLGAGSGSLFGSILGF